PASSKDSGNNTNWTFPAATLTWTGAASSAWNNAANWNLGYVPNSTDNVIISAAVNSATLDAAHTVHNLTIQAGRALNLAGKNLTLTGAFSNAGTFELQGVETITGLTQDTAEGTWQYDGTGAVATFTVKDFGATDYYNLVINDLTGNGTFQITSALGL